MGQIAKARAAGLSEAVILELPFGIDAKRFAPHFDAEAAARVVASLKAAGYRVDYLESEESLKGGCQRVLKFTATF